MISWAAKPFVTSKTTQHHQIPPEKHKKNHTAHFTFTIQKPQKKIGCELDCRDLTGFTSTHPDLTQNLCIKTCCQPRGTENSHVSNQPRCPVQVLTEHTSSRTGRLVLVFLARKKALFSALELAT